ncbi:hypothetical protein RZS08_14050, partial [Arthrospira platensis SPKY1]|nr:hypothetical protein [Arthrospira platensis SPKY1]
LRDYDGDGIQDIFAHYPAPINGIIAYRGYFDAENKIAFELYPFWEGYPQCIYFEQINGSKTPIYVNNVDYPVVTDVDGDGDLDVLTFNPAGGWVDYLQNRSVQLGYGRDSLIFKKADFCWGKFYEASFSEEIVLSPDPNQCATGLTGDPDVNNRHPGS